MKRKMVWSMAALLAGAGFAAAQDVELTSGRTGYDAMQASQVVAMPGPGCGTGLCNTGCSNYGIYVPRFYGSLEAVVWRLGGSFSDSGSDTLPAIRSQMPFGVLSRSVIIAPDGTTTTRDIINNFGIANISPVLFSGSNLDSQDRNGGRLILGANWNDEWGAEMTFFQLERKGASFTAGAGSTIEGFSNGLNNLVLDGLGGAVEEPTVFNPNVQVVIEGNSRSEFRGLDAVVKHHAFTVGQTRFSELYGARYLELEEEQNLTQILAFNDPEFVGGLRGDFIPGITNFTTLLGSYSARNQFYGFTIGGRIEGDWSRFYYNMTGKLSAGAIRQELNISEFVFTTETTDLADGTPANTIPTTTYPNPTVLHENRTRLAFVLEGGINGGYRVTDSLSVFAGYNIIVMSKVLRPNQGNGLPAEGAGTVSLDNGGNAPRGPSLTHFSENRFVAHGVSLGLEFRF